MKNKMEKEIDLETKIIALLSGYVGDLRDGKDYLETTYKTAKQIAKLKINNYER